MTDRWQRLSQHLDDLFELDAPSRGERLLALAVDDPELAAELRRLLAADERSGVLDAGIAHAAPTVMSQLAEASTTSTAPRAEAGKHIGHYRLLERVGSGGMGEVWRGERSDGAFEQQVAIKLIRPLIDSPQLRERFARERRILARLDHPNIARLLDGGVSEDGTPWYAMEYVRGVDLVRYAEAQALDPRGRVALLLQVCDAVAHAQTLLIVHRDLKPSNVLVDAEGRARVLDFGIARLLDDSSDANLTGTGVRVFSPAYAAPEQIRGDAVGTSADVYSLGAVLYELLTGRVPHPQRSASPDRLLAGLADEAVLRPSQALRDTTGTEGDAMRTRSARELVGDLDTIVATALQPDAARRYAGAAQLADDLRRWIDGRPIAAQPDTAGYRMRKFVSRHRIAVGSASAVLLALIGGLGLALWQANIAREHAKRADAEAARANHVKEYVLSLFREQDPIARAALQARTPGQLIGAGLQRARQELAADPELRDAIVLDLVSVQLALGDATGALAELTPLLASQAEGSVTQARVEATQAAALASLGKHGEALSKIERAVTVLRRDLGADENDTMSAESTLARVAMGADRSRYPEALALMRSIHARHREQYGENDVETLARLVDVAMMLDQMDQLDEAVALAEQAQRGVEKTLGTQHPRLIAIHVRISDIRRRQQRYEESLQRMQQAVATARHSFRADHQTLGKLLLRQGDILRRLQRHDEAEQSFSEAAQALPEQSPDMAQLHLFRGALRRAQRRYEEAAQEMGQAAAIFRASIGDNNVFTWTAVIEQGNTLVKLGALERAEPLLVEADQRMSALSGPDSYDAAVAAGALGGLRQVQGRWDEAIAAHERSLAGATKAYGAEHPVVLASLFDLARDRRLRGQAGDVAWAREQIARVSAAVQPDTSLALLEANIAAESAHLAFQAGDAAEAAIEADRALRLNKTLLALSADEIQRMRTLARR